MGAITRRTHGGERLPPGVARALTRVRARRHRKRGGERRQRGPVMGPYRDVTTRRKTTTAGICQALASAAENDDSRALARATARQRRKMTTAGFGIGPHKATGPHKGDGTTAPQDAAENDDNRDLSRAQARRWRDNTADKNTAENDDSGDLAEALTTATARQRHSQTHGGERRQQGKDPSGPHNDVTTTADNDDSTDLSQALASAARTTTAGTCPGPRTRTNVPNLSS